MTFGRKYLRARYEDSDTTNGSVQARNLLFNPIFPQDETYWISSGCRGGKCNAHIFSGGLRYRNRLLVLDHPLQVHHESFSHVLLYFFQCISYRYTGRSGEYVPYPLPPFSIMTRKRYILFPPRKLCLLQNAHKGSWRNLFTRMTGDPHALASLGVCTGGVLLLF